MSENSLSGDRGRVVEVRLDEINALRAQVSNFEKVAQNQATLSRLFLILVISTVLALLYAGYSLDQNIDTLKDDFMAISSAQKSGGAQIVVEAASIGNKSYIAETGTSLKDIAIYFLGALALWIVGSTGLKRLETYDQQFSQFRMERREESEALRREIDQRLAQLVDITVENEIDKRVDKIAEIENNLNNRLSGFDAELAKRFQPFEWIKDLPSAAELAGGKDRVSMSMGELHNQIVQKRADQGDRSDIRLLIEAVLQSDPDGSPDDFFNTATALDERKLEDLAWKVCEAGIKVYPKNIDLMSQGLRCALHVNEKRQAERLLEKLLDDEIQKNWNWRAIVFIGDYYVEIGDSDKAVTHLLSNAERVPEDERSYAQAAQILTRRGQLDAAMKICDDVIDNKKLKRIAQIAGIKSEIHMDRAEYDQALEAVSLALEGTADPQPSVYQSSLVWRRGAAYEGKLWKFLEENDTLDGEGKEEAVELARRAILSYEAVLEGRMRLPSPRYDDQTRERTTIIFSSLIERGVSKKELEEKLETDFPASGGGQGMPSSDELILKVSMDVLKVILGLPEEVLPAEVEKISNQIKAGMTPENVRQLVEKLKELNSQLTEQDKEKLNLLLAELTKPS